MSKNPRSFPDQMASPESGRPMVRGEKQVTLEMGGRSFSYLQPGWWCSVDDADDMEGQLVDDDNLIAEMARRTAKAMVAGEEVFVPVVIRAIRLACGLTQREAGDVFGTGMKSISHSDHGLAEVVWLETAAERGAASTFRTRICATSLVTFKKPAKSAAHASAATRRSSVAI